MKTRFSTCLLLVLLASGTISLSAQSDPGDAFFLDWGKRFNHAWWKLDTLALQELLADDMLISTCFQSGIGEQTKAAFISAIKSGIPLGYNGLIWGKNSPYFNAKDTLAVRRSGDGKTVWLLQNYYYKEEWRQNNRMKQDSGIISMQTTFQPSGGKWQPLAAFINVFPLKKTNSFGCLTKVVNCVPYAGKPFRFQAAAKGDLQGGGSASLWARIDKKNGEVAFFDNMSDQGISGKEWAVYKIEGAVSADADSLFFGGCITAPGTVWFDEFQLEVEESPGKWKSIPFENSGFETVTPSGKPFTGWSGNVFNFTNFSTAFSLQAPYRGKYAFEIIGKPE